MSSKFRFGTQGSNSNLLASSGLLHSPWVSVIPVPSSRMIGPNIGGDLLRTVDIAEGDGSLSDDISWGIDISSVVSETLGKWPRFGLSARGVCVWALLRGVGGLGIYSVEIFVRPSTGGIMRGPWYPCAVGPGLGEVFRSSRSGDIEVVDGWRRIL
jgi:hypothetical protein